jgi:sodium ion-translocating decarboxylase beta subunit
LPNQSCIVLTAFGEASSGSYSAAFQFKNFTGSGAVWLEREIAVSYYNKYEISIEFYCKLVEDFKNHPNFTINLKPLIYIGQKNPNSLDADDFEKLTDSYANDWAKLKYRPEPEKGSTEQLWIAVGVWTEVSPTTGSTSPGPNQTGVDFTIFTDDLKITIDESEMNNLERIIMYSKAAFMFAIGGTLIFLAIRKKYEPLLLLPIGTGIILTNIPIVGMMEPGGILYLIYQGGIKTGLFPLLIFLGIGAMTDFGPMLANPKTSLLGAAAQFGIFTTLFGALLLGFSLSEASSIGIIGGADGPTAIYLSIKLAPHLLGPIAIAAYSYMALVPIIQPPIIRALTTEKERKVKMQQMRFVSQREKVLFPLGVIIICAFILPQATPLIGMLMFGNLMRESGVVQRLADAASNELINIVTIFLGISVGATMIANTFLTFETIAIILLGLAAFMVGTAMGVIFGKIMYKFTGGLVNPMIGAAGVSAVPMAARVVQNEGVKADPANHLLMHAMGPNVAGVIGSAVVAGVLLTFVGGG